MAEFHELGHLGVNGGAEGGAKCVSLEDLECSGCLLEAFSGCNRPMV